MTIKHVSTVFSGPSANNTSQNRSTFLRGSLSARCCNGWCCRAGKLKESFLSPLTAVNQDGKNHGCCLGCSMVQSCLQGLPIPPHRAVSRMMFVQQPVSHCSSSWKSARLWVTVPRYKHKNSASCPEGAGEQGRRVNRQRRRRGACQVAGRIGHNLLYRKREGQMAMAKR